MARVKRGVTAHARHKKVLDLAKGYRGRGSKAYRVALENGENPLHEKNENGTDGPLIDVSGMRTAILQVGYDKNRAGYKFTEIDDAFELFKVAQQIWKAEIGTNQPRSCQLH